MHKRKLWLVIGAIALVATASLSYYLIRHGESANDVSGANDHQDKHGWFAMASSENGAWGVETRTTKREAEDRAMQTCEAYAKVKCTLMEPSHAIGFYAVATSSTGVAWGYSPDDVGLAQQKALDECASITSTDNICLVKWTGSLGVAMPTAQTVQTSGNCAPKERYTCESQCQNTNCIVRFDNGCTMNVIVNQHAEWKYEFNPVNNRHENQMVLVTDDPCRTAAGF